MRPHPGERKILADAGAAVHLHRLVDHLERDGLVERVPDADDRRSVRARLTEAGRVRIEAIWKEGLEHQFEIVEGFNNDDLAQLRHLCLQLVENARKELGK